MVIHDRLMKLSDYLTQSGTRQLHFARQIGASPGHLHDILSGRRQPSLTLAKRIAAETGGAVPINEWPTIAAIIAAATEQDNA